MSPAMLLLTGLMAFPGQATVTDALSAKCVNCRARLLLNGAEVRALDAGAEATVELALAEGPNVVALEVGSAAEGAAVGLSWASLRRFADPVGPWLAGTGGGDQALTALPPPAGFAPAPVEKGLIPVPAGDSRLRQLVYVLTPTPVWFPKMDRAFAVQGTSQLFKPYLPPLGLPMAYDYELSLALPAGLSAVCTDGGVGAEPSDFRTTAAGDAQLVILSYDRPPGSAFGVFICWQNASKTTIAYEPVLRIGGTHDWERITARTRAPEDAAYARPIILKWASDKVVGEAWIDNLALAPAGAPDRNLLDGIGDFEAELWEKQSGMVMAGPDGGRCFSCALKEDDQTRGWWVPRDGAVEVEGGGDYVLAADVKAEAIHVPGASPHAAILVACGDGVAPGEREAALLGRSRRAGARTMPVTTTVEVLPPLRDRRPEHVRLMPCYYSDPFREPRVIQAYAENAYRSGVNWTYGYANCELARLLLPRGHKVVCSLGRQPFMVGGDVAGYVKEHPEVQAVKFDGTRLANTACPTWFLSDEGSPAREELRAEALVRLATGEYAGLDWDIEQPVVEPPNFCVCERCLAAFRDFAGPEAPADLKPDSLLQEPLRARWVDFRCRHNARLVEMVGRWVREAQPGLEFSVYSGYQNVFTREHYGVDWALLAPHLDAGMSGYGFNAEAEAAAREALAGKDYLAGELYYLSPTGDERVAPNPRHWANRVLRQIAYTGGHGIVIWYLPVYDGAVFYQTSLAAETIAEHERFFTEGERVEGDFTAQAEDPAGGGQAPGLKDNDWFALRVGDEALLLVLNFSDQPLRAALVSEKWQTPGTFTVEPWGRLVRVLARAR